MTTKAGYRRLHRPSPQRATGSATQRTTDPLTLFAAAHPQLVRRRGARLLWRMRRTGGAS